MPSHRIHFRHSYRFLRERGLEPGGARIRDVDLLIDGPELHARRILSVLWSSEEALRCVEEEFGGHSIVYHLPGFKHDMRTQRYSPRKTGWSRYMISVLRRLFKCLYGEDYGLLVDLHVLLDMAYKWCCDDELLLDWARDVGIHPLVIDYYRRHRDIIDLDLSCSERLLSNGCGLRSVARWVRGKDFEG